MLMGLCLFFSNFTKYAADLRVPGFSGIKICLALLIITEFNVLNNNPSFLLTKSNRNLMYQDAEVLSRLETCS